MVADYLIMILRELCIYELEGRKAISVNFFVSIKDIKVNGYQINTSKKCGIDISLLWILEQSFKNNFDETHKSWIPDL